MKKGRCLACFWPESEVIEAGKATDNNGEKAVDTSDYPTINILKIL
jgi:hypothetical protein